MYKILLLEPDRISSKLIYVELTKRGFAMSVATTADSAIETADKINPDLVICELSLPGHSGSEFIYEFRTYEDWQEVPILIYSSVLVPSEVIASNDWSLLNIARVLYKPDFSLNKLADLAEELAEAVA